MSVVEMGVLREEQLLKTAAESTALGEGLLVIVLLMLLLLLGQLPSPVSSISRCLFQTFSLISSLVLPSCLDIHTITCDPKKPVTSIGIFSAILTLHHLSFDTPLLKNHKVMATHDSSF